MTGTSLHLLVSLRLIVVVVTLFSREVGWTCLSGFQIGMGKSLSVRMCSWINRIPHITMFMLALSRPDRLLRGAQSGPAPKGARPSPT